MRQSRTARLAVAALLTLAAGIGAERTHASAQLVTIGAERTHASAQLTRFVAERTHVNVPLANDGAERTDASAKIGEAAPEFVAPDSRGESHSLATHSGSFVVLEWINHDCPFVRKHYSSGNMQALQKKYTELGVVWLSVASSAPGKQGHLAADAWNAISEEKGSFATAVLLDPEGTIGRAYGARTTPQIAIIDPKGILIYAGAIDDTPSADVDDIATSRNHVAEALDEALAGRPVSVTTSQPYGCSVKY